MALTFLAPIPTPWTQDLNKWDVQISEAKARLDRLVKDREVAAQQSAQLLEDMDDARGRRTSLEAQKAKHEENLKVISYV